MTEREAFETWVRSIYASFPAEKFPDDHPHAGEYHDFMIDLGWEAWKARGELELNFPARYAPSISHPSENPSSIQVCPGSPASRNEEGAVTSEVRGESSSIDGQLNSHPNALVNNPASDTGENRPMKETVTTSG